MHISELVGSSHKIGSQRKFYHKKDFEFFKDGERVGSVCFDFKMTEDELRKELLEFKNMSEADTIVLVWTAQKGWMNEIIDL